MVENRSPIGTVALLHRERYDARKPPFSFKRWWMCSLSRRHLVGPRHVVARGGRSGPLRPSWYYPGSHPDLVTLLAGKHVKVGKF